TFFFPTLLLPLGILIRENPNLSIIPPTNPNVLTYYNIMTEKKKYESGRSYIPIMGIPHEEDRREQMFEDFISSNLHQFCGGKEAFAYVVGELTTNIYEHSNYSHAYIAAQNYPTLKCTEITIIDNGISIPHSYEVNSIPFHDDCDALSKAINGVSTKSTERGFGLGTSLDLLRIGLNSSCLLVSRKSELITEKERMIYKLLENYDVFSGTLISARIPYKSEKVDIYDFVE
ncbi:MAG: hypothetical protein ACXACR_05765, partial [Candidatus Hodarchaeales archaeon]